MSRFKFSHYLFFRNTLRTAACVLVLALYPMIVSLVIITNWTGASKCMVPKDTMLVANNLHDIPLIRLNYLILVHRSYNYLYGELAIMQFLQYLLEL